MNSRGMTAGRARRNGTGEGLFRRQCTALTVSQGLLFRRETPMRGNGLFGIVAALFLGHAELATAAEAQRRGGSRGRYGLFGHRLLRQRDSHPEPQPADGLRFTQFYNTPRCSPTRAALLTGLYPHQAGMGWLDDKAESRSQGYPPKHPEIGETFSKNSPGVYVGAADRPSSQLAADRTNYPGRVCRGSARLTV